VVGQRVVEKSVRAAEADAAPCDQDESGQSHAGQQEDGKRAGPELPGVRPR
jgi:hypothetical protein